MKWLPFMLLALAAHFLQGCAAQKEPMDSVRYEKAVQKQFDENYQERLKQ